MGRSNSMSTSTDKIIAAAERIAALPLTENAAIEIRYDREFDVLTATIHSSGNDDVSDVVDLLIKLSTDIDFDDHDSKSGYTRWVEVQYEGIAVTVFFFWDEHVANWIRSTYEQKVAALR